MVQISIHGDRVRFEVQGWDKLWTLKTQLEQGGRLDDLVKKFGDKNWEKHRPPNFAAMVQKFDDNVKRLGMP